MPEPQPQSWRSACPVNIALEILGDRWTLLILRDVLLFQRSTFKDFQESPEKIASNILADRLKKLQQHGILESHRSESDARVIAYRPTTKGLDLLPVLIELILWTDRYEETGRRADRLLGSDAPHEVIAEIKAAFADPTKVAKRSGK
ncbi:MAG: helix-turn-helix domain-containing protein [Pirellulaceae bacterium]